MAWGRARREHITLLRDMLFVMIRHPEGVAFTRLHYGVGVPFKRSKKLLSDLLKSGLAKEVPPVPPERHTKYFITKKGLKFVRLVGQLERIWEKGD